jgi:SAM-dependent methyltransferase
VADNREAWNKWSTEYQARSKFPTDVVQYGPDIPTEVDLKLLGTLEGKRVLELGCGGGQNSIAMAKQGATAIGVDFSTEQLAYARSLAEREGVRIELREGDFADLAFLRAETIDLALSVCAFQFAEDVGRIFRQVHRVLKPEGALVFSLPHPAYNMIDPTSDQPMLVRRSYFDNAPMDKEKEGIGYTEHHHTVEDLFSALTRSGYRVDTLLEPAPASSGPRSAHWHEAARLVPRTLLVRGRKEGR